MLAEMHQSTSGLRVIAHFRKKWDFVQNRGGFRRNLPGNDVCSKFKVQLINTCNAYSIQECKNHMILLVTIIILHTKKLTWNPLLTGDLCNHGITLFSYFCLYWFSKYGSRKPTPKYLQATNWLIGHGNFKMF
jgi:hypothetical protein